MKYRRLSASELQDLETEFVQFLVANTVTSDDWVKLKEEEPEKAEQLIDLFSDIVFEKVIAGIEYLEVKSPKDLKTFHCQEDKIILLGLRVNGESQLDFTKSPDPQQMMQMLQLSGAKLQLYSAEKAYQPNRNEELFRMMQAGALISKDGFLYKTLEDMKK